MHRILSFSLAIAVALSLAMGVGMGVVGAQTTVENATDEIEDDEPTPEPEPDGEIVDSSLTLTEWEWTGEAFVLTFDADMSTGVTVTPSQQSEAGAAQVSWVSELIPRGGGTITVPADEIDGGAAVTITTQESRSENRGVRVSTGMDGDDPFRHFGGHSGLFTGVLLTVGMAGLGAAYVVRTEDSGVVEA